MVENVVIRCSQALRRIESKLSALSREYNVHQGNLNAQAWSQPFVTDSGSVDSG